MNRPYGAPVAQFFWRKMISKIRTFYLFLILLSFSGSINEASAQTNTRRTRQQEEDSRLPMRNDRGQEGIILSSPTVDRFQPLEAAVDPKTYIVGPGDVFQISIFANSETNVEIPVNPEGALIIPTIGTIAVDGKTLAEVQKIVREEGAKKYLQSPITAHLTRLRQFRVHITGQVQQPGVYDALAVDRVSDLIEQAGGLSDWAAERSVEVRHLDGTVEIVDLYQYKNLGNLDANLHLKSGDLVYVPPITFTKATVRVEGSLDAPGVYQLLENETLHDFLLRVKAFNKHADLLGAYVERKNETKGAAEIIPISASLEKAGNGFSEFYLKDGDVIMVPNRQHEVSVIGAVRSPGRYPFYPNMRAIDYLGLAGATEQAVKPSKIRVIRAGENDALKGYDLPLQPGDTVVVPERAKFGFQEITTLILTLTNIVVTFKAVGAI